MKVLLAQLLSCFFLLGHAQTDCKPYMPSEVGSTWEHTHYSSIDRVIGFTTFEILSKTESGDSSTFQIRASSVDEGADDVYVNDFEVSCINGQFESDMRSRMNGELVPDAPDVEFVVDASKLSIPSLDAAIGTFLENGSLSLQAYIQDNKMYKITVDITDRLIKARETMETTAGTFDCLKISQTIDTRFITKKRTTSNEWYAEGVGLVRSESFNKKGILTGYTLLTAIDAK